MCRVSLIPEGFVPAMERQSVGGGIQVEPEEDRPYSSPSLEPASDLQLAEVSHKSHDLHSSP